MSLITAFGGLLQFGPGIFATPLGRILIAIVLIAIVVLVGKFLLSLAWRVLVIAAVIIGVLVLVSLLL